MTQYKARPYQQTMTNKVIELPACALWAKPGLGKSVSTLSAIDVLAHDRFEVSRWLIVSPKRVTQLTWPKEIAKWDHTRHLSWRIIDTDHIQLQRVAHPKDKSRKVLALKDRAGTKAALLAMRECIHLVSYEQFPHLVRAYGVNFPYDGVVFDEARHLKNKKSLAFRAARSIRDFVKRQVQLTGTPAANGIEDVFFPVGLLDGGERLGTTIGAFRKQFMAIDKLITVQGQQRAVYVEKDDTAARVSARVSDICFAFRKEDWLDLPPLIIKAEWVELPVDAREMYRELKSELVTLIGDREVATPEAAAKMIKLLQIANGRVITYDEHGQEKQVAHVHDEKLDALEDIVDGTAGGIVVGYRYAADREAILRRLGKRAGRIDRLQDWIAGKFQVLVMHPKEGGHGLDGLQTAGHNVVWYGCPHDLDHFEQLNDRLHRHGTQAAQVVVRVICAADTLEEALPDLLQGKHSLQNGLLAALKG
jgi:hypothetical protein